VIFNVNEKNICDILILAEKSCRSKRHRLVGKQESMGDNEQRGEGVETRDESLTFDQNRETINGDRSHEIRPETGEKLMSDDRNFLGGEQAEIAGGNEDKERGADRTVGLEMTEYGNGKEDRKEVGDVPASKTGDGREGVGAGGVVESEGNVAADSVSKENAKVIEGGGILEDSDAEEEEEGNDEEEVGAKSFSSKSINFDEVIKVWCYAEFGR